MKDKTKKSYFPTGGVFTKAFLWGLVKLKFAYLNYAFFKQNKG